MIFSGAQPATVGEPIGVRVEKAEIKDGTATLTSDMTFRTTLISCGILSSLWYAAINVFVPLQWPEYSVVDLTVSELSAIGAPTRALWVAVVAPYTLLFTFFGWGVLRSAAGNKWLRVTGWLIILYSAFNIYWPPMHTREMLAAGGGTLTDTLHLTWAGVTVFLLMLIFAFGAASQGKRFRIYTIVSAITLLTFGLLTALSAPNGQANLATPLAGLYERINIGVFLLWVIVLATILLRTAHTEPSTERA